MCKWAGTWDNTEFVCLCVCVCVCVRVCAGMWVWADPFVSPGVCSRICSWLPAGELFLCRAAVLSVVWLTSLVDLGVSRISEVIKRTNKESEKWAVISNQCSPSFTRFKVPQTSWCKHIRVNSDTDAQWAAGSVLLQHHNHVSIISFSVSIFSLQMKLEDSSCYLCVSDFSTYTPFLLSNGDLTCRFYVWMNALVNFTPTHGNNLFMLLSTRHTSESTAFRLM